MSDKNSNIKEICFISDGFRLQGFLHLPSINCPPVVIGSHGLYSNSNSPKQIALANQCNRYGIAYFRFDHRGCGDSEGKFEEVTSLETRCRDLSAAVTAIIGKANISNRFGLFGSSMGGTVCLSIASELGADTLVTFAAPIRSRISKDGFPMSTNPEPPSIFLNAQNSPFDITNKLRKISNILIFHGEADDVVPVSHAEEIYDLTKQPKELIRQKQGDHPMSNGAHQKFFIKEASLWFKRGLSES
jgi:alpha-beta hydrolase superfamily lysophospholipase